MSAELSEECKQKLREIERGLSSVRDRLLVMRETSPWTIADRAALSSSAAAIDGSFAAMETLDKPCREVLRGIDLSAASFVTSRLRTLPAGGSFEDQVEAQELLQSVEELQFAVQRMFFEAL